MNRQEYLSALEKALVTAGVREYTDIMEEYSEHFNRKTADGYGEEEIAARLAPPQEIAGQYREIGKNGSIRSGGTATNAVLTIGVVFLDIIVIPIIIMFFVCIFAFGIFTFSCVIAGILCIIFGQSVGIGDVQVLTIPPMPYISALLIGITLLALAFIAAVGTENCRLYVAQMVRKYARWHKNVLGKSRGIDPPLPLHPWITAKKRKVMRSIALVSLVIFTIGLVSGFMSMVFAARSVEPWHVWHWFE